MAGVGPKDIPPMLAAVEPVGVPPMEIRSSQHAFCEALLEGRQAYSQASNDLKRSKARGDRKEVMAKLGNQAMEWVGTISKLTTTRKGAAILEVSLAAPCEDFTMATQNNEASELLSRTKTLIQQDDPMFTSLAALREGQQVMFVGRLQPDPESIDAFGERSLTEKGSMEGGTWVTKFSEVHPREGRVILALKNEKPTGALIMTDGDQGAVMLMKLIREEEQKHAWVLNGTSLAAGKADVNGAEVELKKSGNQIMFLLDEAPGELDITQGDTHVSFAVHDLSAVAPRLQAAEPK